MGKRAFRLFVSSTFRDFEVERRLLQERVFPSLERLCAENDCSFRAVDMRWGVSEGAQTDQRTSDLCLGEVLDARSFPHPNLLILCGDRYGWVPLPFAIAADVFEAVREWITSSGAIQAVAALDHVYQRDDNHWIAAGLRDEGARLLAAYTLRPRDGDLADLADPVAWAQVEDLLREHMQAAADHLHREGRLDAIGRARFFRSLTEQEIRLGLQGAALDEVSAIAWIRTTPAAEPGARALAEYVAAELSSDQVVFADAQAAGYEESFCSEVYALLKGAIAAHLETLSAGDWTQAAELALEQEAHDQFERDRLRVFSGRTASRTAIARYLRDPSRHPLVLTGPSGSGKSALMARAAADGEAINRAPVVKRFVGASAESTEARALLISICEELESHNLITTPDEWEASPRSLAKQVRTLLERIQQPVAIFVDALDQLRAPRSAEWLPSQLPRGVKIVVSALDDEKFPADRDVLDELEKVVPPKAILPIEPLSTAEGGEILDALQRDAQRGLTDAQRSYILQKFRAAGGAPLYLVIAFSMARLWRSSDDVSAHELAGDVTSLIEQYIDDLSGGGHHAHRLVSRTLGLIAAGRRGLSEGELISVLSRDEEVMAAVSSERFGAHTARLPDSVWVRLRRDLAALLVEKKSGGEPVLQFFHRQAAEVARARFYEADRAALHLALVDQFDPRSAQDDLDPPWTRRGFIELPFQLFHAEQRERLDALLENAAWIDNKIAAFGDVEDTVSDYTQYANTAIPLHKSIGETLRLAAGHISRDPSQRLSQLHGRLLGGAWDDFVAQLKTRMPEGTLCATAPALARGGGELARLDSSALEAMALLPDGRLAGLSYRYIVLFDPAKRRDDVRLRRKGTIVASALHGFPDGKIACGDRDGHIEVWDAEHEVRTARFRSRGGEVRALASMQNGLLASGSGGVQAKDYQLRIWDVSKGRELQRMPGHSGGIRALVAMCSGSLASASEDDTIRIWDIGLGRELARFEGGCGGQSSLAELPDGRLVSGARDGSIRIWDLEAGCERGLLTGHDGDVRCLKVLPGGLLASGGSDRTIRVWDLASMRQVACHRGHPGKVKSLELLPSGILASCGELENVVRFWSLSADGIREEERERGGAIRSLLALPDGSVASTSDDESTTIWSAPGQCRLRLEGDNYRGHPLAALADGRILSSLDDSLVIWDASSGDELDRIKCQRRVGAATVLPGDRIAYAGAWGDSKVYVWDATCRQQVAILSGHLTDVSGLVALSDGRLMSSDKYGEICLWQPEANWGVDRFRAGHLGTMRQGKMVFHGLAAFDNDLVVSATSSGTVSLWGLKPQKKILSQNIERGINALAVRPSGGIVLGRGAVASVWDQQLERECARFELDASVKAVACLPDGRIVVGDRLGRLHWLSIKGGRVLTNAAGRDAFRSSSLPNEPDAAIPSGARGYATPESSRRPGSPLGLLFLLLGFVVACSAVIVLITQTEDFGWGALSDWFLSSMLNKVPRN